MSPLKVAILEDNPLLLKDLKMQLENTGLVTVIAHNTDPNKFIDKIKESKPEALVLDIEINGANINGIDIANRFDLHVLFASGKTKNYIENIEELNLNSKQIIEHVSKPIRQDKLEKILPKFISQIHALQKSQYIYLKINKYEEKIEFDDIVFLDSDKKYNSKSNNKRIYFRNRKPETLIDFSFSGMKEKGFDKKKFMRIHKSYVVNVSLLEPNDLIKNKLSVTFMENDKKVEKELTVSKENITDLNKLLRK